MIQIAFVENRTSGVVKSLSLDLEKLSERLAHCDIGQKDGQGWMPALIEPGQRTAERIKSVSLLVLDVEAKAENVEGVKKIIGPEPPAPDAMSAELGLWGWRCILHTSYNHTAEHPRYRLVFDIDRHLVPAEVKPLGLHVAALLGIGDCIDTGCLEPARLFYLPRCPAERKNIFHHADIEGVALPVDELLAEAGKIGAAKKSLTRRTGQSASVIEAFNHAHDVGLILEQHGYQPHGRRRWLWSGSTTRQPGVRLLPDAVPERVYSSHGGDPLNDGHAHDAFDLWRILRHGNDLSAAVKDAARICGMATRTASPAGASTPAMPECQPPSDHRAVGTDEAREWPALDSLALHGLAGDIVRTIEPHSESDPAAILVQVLLAFGVHVGRGPHVAVEGDQHHGNLFALLVGNTSKGRKGTAWGRVRELFQRIPAWVITVSGLSSGEGLKWNVRDATEGKSEKDVGDPGAADKRLLVVEAEFSQALRATARIGNTLSSTIREAWDTGNLRTLTKNDPIVATGAHIAIIGHITVSELQSELTETDRGNGFANRFLFVCVKRSKVLPFGGGNIDESDLQKLVGRLTRASELAHLHGRSVTMTPEARAVWIKVYPALSEGLAGLLGAVTGRAEAQCVRLALLYALLDEKTQIDEPHLLAAIAVWEYCEQSARFIFGSVIGNQIADEILRALRSAGSLTRTEINKVFRGHQPTEKINVALSMLSNRSFAHAETQRTDGRSVEVWRPGCAKEAKEAK